MKVILVLTGLAIVSMLSELFRFKKILPVIIYIGLAAAFALDVFWYWGTEKSYYHDMLFFNSYAIAFTGLLILLTFLWFLMADHYFDSESSRSDHYALILFALIGGIVMTSFNDLSMLFIGLEILSISLYVLAGSNKTDLRSNEAALKYFMLGAFATGFLLFGIALIYGACGSFNIARIGKYLAAHQGNLPIIFKSGIILMMIGLAFKVSAVPFHFWAPDVYDGAPTVITAFMATVVKTAAFAAFYRLFSVAFGNLSDWWTGIIAILSALSMIVGNVLAVYQSGLKRLLAYSSIAHAGYMLLALVAANSISASSILLYSTAYSIASMGAFTVLNSLGGNLNVDSLKGLSKKNPAMAVLMTITMLSMAGIPPLAGFFAKYYIFYAILQQGYIWLTIVAVISSLIGVYYYFRVIISMYQDSDQEDTVFSFSGISRTVLLVVTLLTIFVGIMPDFLVKIFH